MNKCAHMINYLENMLFDTNIKDDNICVNKNIDCGETLVNDNKKLINENNALKIKIHLLNDELESIKQHNNLLKTQRKLKKG